VTPDSTRRYPRIHKLFLLAFVNCEEGRQRSPVSMGRIFDLNQAGVGIEVFQEIQVGTEMEMEIGLHDTVIHAHGKVAYSRPEGDGVFKLGIEFSELQEQLAAQVVG
jgi:hypothetical protein